MKKINGLMITTVLGLGIILGGCAGGPAATPDDTVAESPIRTIKGTIRIAGRSIFIDEGNGKSTEVTSRKVDLGEYIGQEVEVTGEFSGTTLYVDEIK